MFEDPNIKQNFEEYWSTPRMQTADWIEHAIMMADRFNRIFLRTLRQMRDLRRYSVTINNPQQVNIAAEGGQQVNAVKVENSKKLKARNGKRH